MLDRSWKTGSVRPYSQEELPHVGQHSLGIDPSPDSLVRSGPVKKAFYNSYSLRGR